MLKKNDPLADVVKGIMQQTSLRKQIEEKLHEELGIQSRKQVPHELVGKYDSALAEAQEKGLDEAKDMSPGAWIVRKDKREARQFEKQDQRYAAKSNRKYKKLTRDTINNLRKASPDDQKEDVKESVKAGDIVMYKGERHEVLHVHGKKAKDATSGKEIDSEGKVNIRPVRSRRPEYPKTVSIKDLKEENKKDESKDHADYPHESKVSDVKVDHSKKSDKDYHKDVNEGIVNSVIKKLTAGNRRAKLVKKIDKALDDRQKEHGIEPGKNTLSNMDLLIKDKRYNQIHNGHLKENENSVLRKPGQSISSPAVAGVPATQPAAMAPSQAAVPSQSSVPIKPATEAAKKSGTEKKPETGLVAPASPSWVSRLASAKAPVKKG